MNFWETFYKNKLMLAGSGLVLLLLIVSLLAPWLAPFDPGQIDLTQCTGFSFDESFVWNGSTGSGCAVPDDLGREDFLESRFCGHRSRHYYRNDSRVQLRDIMAVGLMQ